MRLLPQLAGAASIFAMTSLLATPAFAQSTGTQDFEKDIVVSAHKVDAAVGGVAVPDTSKAKATLTQEWIKHQIAGQSVNDLINYLPGVSYTNNDPYGGTSGNLWIRGFDGTRISETFDGVTLNDDGGYSLYAGELLDTELIDSVTVNLGTTDVDSPTSSATGSTVNFVSHMPSDTFGVKASGGYGTDDYYRVFGMIETGQFGPWGTKGWFSASKTFNSSPFNNYGKIRKHEFNGKLYQPLSNPGDFVSLAGFYVVLRNNFSGSDPLSTTPINPDAGTGFQQFPTSFANSYYTYPGCTTAPATAGKADATPNTCGTAFEYRPNPANLLNIRAAMKLTLAPGLTLTADPSYQFTKANGGGTAKAKEGFGTYAGNTAVTGFVNGTIYAGRDLNGDADTLDTVNVYIPSETKTHRVALTSSLRYDINPAQTVRLSYAFARSMITQTGEATFLNADGSPINVYATNDPIVDANGNALEKRDTLSIAELNQVSGEYRGQFLDRHLTVTAGVRAPFLHRVLTNYCYTTGTTTSTLGCVFGASGVSYGAATPYAYNTVTGKPTGAAPPQTRKYNYNAILPNIGFTYKQPGYGEVFFNFSEGFQAPYSTALYNSFWYPQGTAGVEPKPEKTDNFDLGYRYNQSRLSTQIDLWYTHYANRLGSAYDPVQQANYYQNLGRVQRYGIDANAAYKITPHVNAYGFVSWMHSKIEANVDNGSCATAGNVSGVAAGQVACIGGEAYLLTAGKVESAAPHFTVGGRLQGDVGPLTVGVQAKYTGVRYVNDENVGYYTYASATPGVVTPQWPAKLKGYATVDLDARYSLKNLLNDRSYVQLNVTNLFNHFYVGSINATTSATTTTGGYVNNAYPGAPRAVIGSLTLAY